MIDLLQAHIDDSKTREDVLVLAGYIAHSKRWEEFSIEWQKLLDEHPPWEEFKMARAASHLPRDEKLYRVVEDHAAGDVAEVVEIGPLRQLCNELGLCDPLFERLFTNPYNFAIKAILAATFRELASVGLKHPIEFIFDRRGESGRILDNWDHFLAGMPDEALPIIYGEPRFEKSSDVLPLQSAEIIAWHVREHWLKHRKFEEGIIPLSWPQAKPVHGHLVHWDYEALKPNLESQRRRLERMGVLPQRPIPIVEVKFTFSYAPGCPPSSEPEQPS